ncbi:hypothetical protein B0H10DRAFT_1949577 [Mycena sp. CBHHK59/15]|nr:hypothetical protein B0H10DRAFT_1949577 [Mycena sp. CBHHK59/15]
MPSIVRSANSDLRVSTPPQVGVLSPHAQKLLLYLGIGTGIILTSCLLLKTLEKLFDWKRKVNGSLGNSQISPVPVPASASTTQLNSELSPPLPPFAARPAPRAKVSPRQHPSAAKHPTGIPALNAPRSFVTQHARPIHSAPSPIAYPPNHPRAFDTGYRIPADLARLHRTADAVVGAHPCAVPLVLRGVSVTADLDVPWVDSYYHVDSGFKFGLVHTLDLRPAEPEKAKAKGAIRTSMLRNSKAFVAGRSVRNSKLVKGLGSKSKSRKRSGKENFATGV